MSAGIVYKKISKKKIFDLNSGELSPDCVFQELKAGNFNHAVCEDFRFTSWGTENILIKNFIWRRGKFRGVFKNCTFSNGELYNIDFWDSDFENVKFVNVSFFDSEINSSYSLRYLFQLKNVSFENCKFNHFWIGQALDSEIFFKDCYFFKSNFRLKSSAISFEKCSTKDGEFLEYIFLSLIETKNIEPIKIKECMFFCLELVCDEIDILSVYANEFYMRIHYSVKINNFKIYSNFFRLDAKSGKQEIFNEIKRKYNAKLSLDRVINNLDVFSRDGVFFRIVGFIINRINIRMIEFKSDVGGAFFYSNINEMHLYSVKLNVMNFNKTRIKKTIIQSSSFDELCFVESSVDNLIFDSVKVAKKILINETKIDRLHLSNCSIDKNAEWESEKSMVALLDVSESDKKEIKNVSGKNLIQYFERSDVKALK